MKQPASLFGRGQQRKVSLLFCILMDIIGYSSYSIPVIGELADLVWAPLSALIFLFSFGIRRGAAGSIFNFIEELLPGTDFIPSFTLMWLWQNFSANRYTGIKSKAPSQQR